LVGCWVFCFRGLEHGNVCWLSWQGWVQPVALTVAGRSQFSFWCLGWANNACWLSRQGRVQPVALEASSGQVMGLRMEQHVLVILAGPGAASGVDLWRCVGVLVFWRSVFWCSGVTDGGGIPRWLHLHLGLAWCIANSSGMIECGFKRRFGQYVARVLRRCS